MQGSARMSQDALHHNISHSPSQIVTAWNNFLLTTLSKSLKTCFQIRCFIIASLCNLGFLQPVTFHYLYFIFNADVMALYIFSFYFKAESSLINTTPIIIIGFEMLLGVNTLSDRLRDGVGLKIDRFVQLLERKEGAQFDKQD